MYIVTGGAGFIGSNILAGLERRADNSDLVVVDRLRDGSKWRNIAKRNIVDIVAPQELVDFLEIHRDKLQAVFHMGALARATETDADKLVANNLKLSTDLFRWCTHNNVKFFYASAATTYGDGSHGFLDHDDPAYLAKLRPLSAYGWSKNQFDRRVALRLSQKRRMPPQWAGFKFFNVYGPNELHKGSQASMISQMYSHAAQSAHFSLFKSHHPDYEDGEQSRDFVWIDDVIDVLMWFLDNPSVSGLFNVGSGQAHSWRTLGEAVYRALGKTPNLRYVDMPEQIRGAYQYHTVADLTKLRAAGYDKLFTALEDGIEQYVRTYLSQRDPHC